MKPVRAIALALLTLAFAPSLATAQDPSPRTILERYNAAIDPQQRLNSIPGMRMVARSEIPNTGMSTELTVAVQPPNRFHMVIGMPGVGQMEFGFDGTTAWTVEMDGRPRLATEEEMRRPLEMQGMRTMGRDPEQFERMEFIATRRDSAETVDCLRLTWRGGPSIDECYARSTGLMVEARQLEAGTSALTRFSDYRVVNGFLLPHRMESIVSMQETTMTVPSVLEYDFAAFAPIHAPASLRPPAGD